VVVSRLLKLVPNDAGIPLNEEGDESGGSDDTTASAVSTVDTNSLIFLAMVTPIQQYKMQ